MLAYLLYFVIFLPHSFDMLGVLLDVLFPASTDATSRAVFVTHPVIEEESFLRERGILHVDTLIAAGPFHGAPDLRKAILRLKYSGKQSDARLLACHFYRLHALACSDVTLCPVPLHWTRKMTRGFNQSMLLARELSTLFGVPVVSLLHRRHMTGHQSRRTRMERLNAFGHNSFTIRKKCESSHVILVDDVATTGATLDACARALKQSGVRRVEAWVMAHDKHS